MVQIISPTRIMPGGLRFVDSNIARQSFNDEDKHRADMNIDRRATARFENEQEDRRIAQEREKIEAELIAEQADIEPGTEYPLYYNSPSPTPSPPPPSAPLGQPERAAGLNTVSSALPPAPPSDPRATPAEPPIPEMQSMTSRNFTSPSVHSLMPDAVTVSETVPPRRMKVASAAQAAPPPPAPPPEPEYPMIDGMPADLYRSGTPGTFREAGPDAYRPGLPGVVSGTPSPDMMRSGVPYARPGGRDFPRAHTDSFTPARTDSFTPAPQRVSSGYDPYGSTRRSSGTDGATGATPRGMEEITVTGRREPRSGLSVVKSKDPVSDFRRQLASRLAKGGHGSAARQSYEQSLTGAKASEDGDWKRAMEILERAESGDINGALLLSQRYGENIPPEVLTNGQARHTAKTALEYAKAYGATHDQEWMAKFTETYGTTGNVQQALRAAGQPKPVAKEFRPLGYAMTSDGRVLNKDTGELAGEARPRGTGRQTNEQINFAWMIAPKEQGGLGWPRDQAEKIIGDMMNTVRNNPGARNNSIMAAARAIVTASYGDKTLAEAVTEATAAMEQIEKATKKPSVPGIVNPTSNPADPDPGTETETRLTATNDEGTDIYSVDGGETWYNAEDDTRYDEGTD